VAQYHNSGTGLVILEVYRSHIVRYIHPLGLPQRNDQLVAEIVTCTTHSKHKRRISRVSVRFKPNITAIARSQTSTLDFVAVGMGFFTLY
jgi:hypothetical protein